MSTPYIGQITVYAFGLIPKNWLPCNGQLLPIQQNQALFSLLGTTYGGDGRTTFGLPNLQSLMAMSFGAAFVQGQSYGEANHTLNMGEMPTHFHPVVASTASGTNSGALQTPLSGNYPAAPASTTLYANSAQAGLTLGSGSSPTGGGQSHPNQQPYLALSFCIATQGIFPTRS